MNQEIAEAVSTLARLLSEHGECELTDYVLTPGGLYRLHIEQATPKDWEKTDDSSA